MKLSTLLVTNNIKQQLAAAYTAPVVLSGAVGLGKTTMVKEICKKNGYEFCQVNLGTLSLVNLSGLPSEEKNDVGELVTTWSNPEIVAKPSALARETGKPVVVLLDDIHAMPNGSEAMSMLLQLLLERQIGNYRLDDRVVLIGTANDTEAAGWEGMPSSVLNRIALHKIEQDFDVWFADYGSKLDPVVSSFVKANPAAIAEEEDNMTPFGTSRSVSFLSTAVSGLPLDVVEANATRIGKQFLSPEMSLTFSSHVNVFMKLDLESKVKARTPINCDELSTLDSMLYSYIGSYIQTEDDGKWFIEQLNNNMKHSSFIGLATGICYSQYSSGEMTKGISFVVDNLLDKNTKLFKDRKAVMQVIGEYII